MIMPEFICENKKYVLGGPQEDSIGLPVSLVGLPSDIAVEGCRLYLRSEFHVSLVCIGKIIEKHHISAPNFVSEVINDFCTFVKTNDIDFLRFRNEFKFVAQNERRSLVVMCDVSNLDKFFLLMNQKYKLNIEYPPTHVTLYALQHRIYLVDSEDIARLTKPIDNPGLSLPGL